MTVLKQAQQYKACWGKIMNGCLFFTAFWIKIQSENQEGIQQNCCQKTAKIALDSSIFTCLGRGDFNIILKSLQKSQAMLKYHLIVPEKTKHNNGIFHHYLTLGSHQSPYSLPHLTSFSIVTLFPKERFPTIAGSENYSTAIIPLKGAIKVDGQTFEQSSESKQVILYNPKDIAASETGDAGATFAYIAVKGDNIKATSIQLKRFQEEKQVELNGDFLFVVQGKVSYSQQIPELSLKGDQKWQQLPAAIYSRRGAKVTVSKDSLILRVKEEV